MSVLVVGLGIQGKKRSALLGSLVVGSVDPVNDEADYSKLEDAPVGEFRDVFLCVPDGAKATLINQALNAGKNILIEKPLLLPEIESFVELENRANALGCIIYTAYNHRFEPHFIEVKKHLDAKTIGKIYQVGMFYGNGTAKLVANSPWRDSGSGVISDLLPHLLDTLNYWFDSKDFICEHAVQRTFETISPDYARIQGVLGEIHVDLEMTLCSWRNTFRLTIVGEKGSMHIDSLCKWGPSTFVIRNRIFPSGKPHESSKVIEQKDPTWNAEHASFFEKIKGHKKTDLSVDAWIQETLDKISRNMGGHI